MSAITIVISFKECGDFVDVAALGVRETREKHVSDHGGHVHKHAGEKIADLHELQVHPLDVRRRRDANLVHGNAPSLLQSVDLFVQRVAALRDEGTELIAASTEVHEIVETVVRVDHVALTERREAQMHHRAVEEQAMLVVRTADLLLHVGHQHQIAGSDELAVHGEVDDLVERGL